jgi:hypothetical protein
MASSAGGEAPWAESAGGWSGNASSETGPSFAPPASVPTSSVEAPLDKIKRKATWSMVWAVTSIFFGLLCIPALVMAFRAQSMARSYGTTAVDKRVRWAKRLAIAFTILWAIWLIAAIAVAASGHTNGG